MLLPGAAQAQDVMDLFGSNVPQMMHSSGLYTFIPPSGWSCQQLRDSSVECRTGNGPSPGVLTITHTTIQGNLDSELMALNSEAQLKKLPHYKRAGGGRLLLGDIKASIRSFTFDYQGNTEYPVAVEELYVVSGSKAIRVHFETMRHAMPAYARDLKQVYDSLGVADVDALGQVVQPAELRNQPKQRGGKLKSGSFP